MKTIYKILLLLFSIGAFAQPKPVKYTRLILTENPLKVEASRVVMQDATTGEFGHKPMTDFIQTLQEVYENSLSLPQIQPISFNPIILKSTGEDTESVLEIYDDNNISQARIAGNGNVSVNRLDYVSLFGGYVNFPDNAGFRNFANTTSFLVQSDRWESNQRINYTGDFSASFTERSLVDKEYVDNSLGYLKLDGSNANSNINILDFDIISNRLVTNGGLSSNVIIADDLLEPNQGGVYDGGDAIIADINYNGNGTGEFIYRYGNGKIQYNQNTDETNITSSTLKHNGNEVATVNYKVYRALLTQTGAGAPTQIVLENTLGSTATIDYTTGFYLATFGDNVLTNNKTLIFTQTVSGNRSFSATRISDTKIELETLDSTGVPADDVLNKTSIEIIVYP